MKKKDVPQDQGMIGEYGREICYAVNENGEYELVQSLGWDPKNIVNDNAWDLIFEEVRSVYEQVRQNKRSPLAFHMVCHQMNPALLAAYAGIAKWRVKRHLKPRVFKGLSPRHLETYARIFEMGIDELKTLPPTLDLESIRLRR